MCKLFNLVEVYNDLFKNSIPPENSPPILAIEIFMLLLLQSAAISGDNIDQSKTMKKPAIYLLLLPLTLRARIQFLKEGGS
jgi:hypothetical protein